MCRHLPIGEFKHSTRNWSSGIWLMGRLRMYLVHIVYRLLPSDHLRSPTSVLTAGIDCSTALSSFIWSTDSPTAMWHIFTDPANTAQAARCMAPDLQSRPARSRRQKAGNCKQVGQRQRAMRSCRQASQHCHASRH